MKTSETPETIVIAGGVAGGASCATRLRRMNESAEIVMLERGPYASFANCGLPYSRRRRHPGRGLAAGRQGTDVPRAVPHRFADPARGDFH